MKGPVFVDTNVLVYGRDVQEPEKQPIAADWMAHLWRSRSGRLSAQVLSEYYATVTRKLRPGRSAALAQADLRNLQAWRPVPLDFQVQERAFALETRYALSWSDATIVAAAQIAGCRDLLTEDLQDGQDFDGLTVRDRFRHPPDARNG